MKNLTNKIMEDMLEGEEFIERCKELVEFFEGKMGTKEDADKYF